MFSSSLLPASPQAGPRTAARKRRLDPQAARPTAPGRSSAGAGCRRPAARAAHNSVKLQLKEPPMKANWLRPGNAS